MKKSKAEKVLDKEIERLYYENCSGVQINIFDISKVFEAGRKAYAEGKDMKDAIISCVQAIRKN
jgi:hypothetical protein